MVNRTGAVRSCVGIAGLALLLLLVPAPLQASAGHKHHNRRHHAKPRVFWKLPGRVSEGQTIPFTWKVKGRFGRKYRLVVQRPVGTARAWRTMRRLRTRRGSAELPAQALGRYRFRLALLRGRRVLAKRVVGIGVFGPVPFSVLFREDGGVYTTPSSSFPYIVSFNPGELGYFDAPPKTAFAVKRNRCSAVHIGFVLGSEDKDGSHDYGAMHGTVTVVQESRDPVTTTAPFDQIASVDAELVPGQTWSVLVDETGTTEQTTDWRDEVYLNGYAICSSTESFS